MEIIFGLLVLLAATRIFAEGAVRLHLPASVGELLAGVCLAGLILAAGDRLPILREVGASNELFLIAEAGIFFLVLQAGIDMKPKDIARASRSSLLIALGGALLPLAAGTGLGFLIFPEGELQLAQSVFVGVVLSITSIPATVKVLREQGMLNTRFGEAIVAAAIFDDIFGLFLLAVLTTLIKSGAVPAFEEIFWMAGQVVLFFAITIPFGAHVYPRVSAKLQSLQLASVEFSTVMVVALAYGLLAELLGLHWVMGAFMAGIFFEPERVGAKAYHELRIVVVGITGGVLGPLFFASIGLEVEFVALSAAPLLVLVLFAVAFAGKLVGAGLPALLEGFRPRQALIVGTGMSARGAVELVVISIALKAGLFAGTETSVISALIATTLLATITTAVLLRVLVNGHSRDISG